jgi:hypothetical protein
VLHTIVNTILLKISLLSFSVASTVSPLALILLLRLLQLASLLKLFNYLLLDHLFLGQMAGFLSDSGFFPERLR